VERAICVLPILPAAPAVTLLCLFYIWRSNGIEYAGITLAIWVLCLIGQAICNKYTRVYKAIDALFSDQRMKLINDLVTGIRTIKSYAWENHYVQKIKEIRAKQHANLVKMQLVGSIGYGVFQNFGFLVIILIFIPMWARGEQIKSESAFSMLAMIFYLFMAITMMVLFSMSTLN
jgi:ABC-type multidrug transport system fused ATPase/permease subunit